jgi:hypothetical protein
MNLLLLKLVSGGQTGADRAALDWAIGNDIPHGGWCPKGRRAEDGPIDARYQLKETPSSDSVQRTEWKEKYEEFLVHEYFTKDGTVGVQITEYDPSDATAYDSKSLYSGVLFLKTDGRVAGRYKLPGWRAGHVQSNSNNSVIVADAYLPQPESNWDKQYWAEGSKFMSLNYPEGDRLRVERLCYHGTSWRTQESHPHAIFSPDDRQVLFSAEVDKSNSVYVVDL